MIEPKECIAQHLYRLILDGEYEVSFVLNDEARLQLKTNKWGKREELVIVKTWNGSHFEFRGININHKLADDAFKIIRDKQQRIRIAQYERDLSALAHDLGLTCKEE